MNPETMIPSFGILGIGSAEPVCIHGLQKSASDVRGPFHSCAVAPMGFVVELLVGTAAGGWGSYTLAHITTPTIIQPENMFPCTSAPWCTHSLERREKVAYQCDGDQVLAQHVSVVLRRVVHH